jgi:hypothetical protein
MIPIGGACADRQHFACASATVGLGVDSVRENPQMAAAAVQSGSRWAGAPIPQRQLDDQVAMVLLAVGSSRSALLQSTYSATSSHSSWTKD